MCAEAAKISHLLAPHALALVLSRMQIYLLSAANESDIYIEVLHARRGACSSAGHVTTDLGA
jgi:hypothetical protein